MKNEFNTPYYKKKTFTGTNTVENRIYTTLNWKRAQLYHSQICHFEMKECRVLKALFKGGSRHKNWCMARVLSFLIRYFSNYYTLHRSDLAARAAPLDLRLYISLISYNLYTSDIKISYNRCYIFYKLIILWVIH